MLEKCQKLSVLGLGLVSFVYIIGYFITPKIITINMINIYNNDLMKQYFYIAGKMGKLQEAKLGVSLLKMMSLPIVFLVCTTILLFVISYVSERQLIRK